MSTPEPPAVTTQDDLVIQSAVGLAETPMGQRVAVMLTILLPKDAALATSKAIEDLAGQLSSTRLVIPGPNGVASAVGQQPG